MLVARREGEGVRHYVHIGTGNYNPKTARIYTDFGLFTADPEIGADIAEMFNYLTGYARPKDYRKVLVAPFNLKDGHPRRDRAHDRGAPAGEAGPDPDEDERAARPPCIRALYRASQAGVEVDLNIRGICSLRPGVPGRLREHPGHLGRRPVPGALPDLLVRARRGDRDLHRLRRPDAAQPLQPGRAADTGRGPGSRPSSTTSSTAPSPTTPMPGSSAADGVGSGARPDGDPPRNLQTELLELPHRALRGASPGSRPPEPSRGRLASARFAAPWPASP